MAATTRATSPGSVEPFPPLEPVPQTPATSQSSPIPTALPTISEHSVLVRPTYQLPPFSSADVSPKLTKPTAFSPRRSPAPLTGAAAMADAKRKRQQDPVSRETTPNPAVAAMQSLIGGGGMSKPTDAPAPNKLSEPLRKAAEHIHIPDRSSTTSAQTSPVSVSSFGTMDQTNGHGGAMTATTTGSNDTLSRFVAEPADMIDSASQTPGTQNTGHEEDEGGGSSSSGNKAFSYPGPPPPQQQQQSNNHEAGPARGMSLPGANYQDSAKASPANKRYKCPYCATDFTRHHNLKSHLLTHSQEKPYVCNTCQARFRRLHDLKRHTKLHTGERPHNCDKCGRRFARGDALARHSKGPGGCAGRRTSFGGDDDGDADGMDGVEYTNDEDEDDGTGQQRRVSEPSRKRVHIETPNDPGRSVYRQHSSTYPPIQHRPGDMGPPAVVHTNSNNSSTSPREMTGQQSINSSYFQNYNQHTGAMTESPKPLSPGQPPDGHRLALDPSSTGISRNRSPSLTTQFQQTHFGRGSISRTPPQPPPAHMGSSNNQLPPLTLSTTAPGRPSLAGPGPSMLHHQQVPPQQASMSGPNSASSHGQSSGSSLRDIIGTGPGPLTTGGDADIWSHFRQLEGKFVRMQDEYELRISRLQEEVMNLRSQLTNVQGAGNYPAEPRY